IEYSAALQKIGANVFAASDFDYGNMGMTCVRRYFDQSWDLFADAIMTPAFGTDEFKLMKNQFISGAQQAEADADSKLRNLAMENVFEGMNYSKIPSGTEASLSALTREDLQSYYKGLMGKKRCFLVVVGDISKADLEQKIKASLANLPNGDLPKMEERISINANPKNKTEARDIATNYIRGYMEAPKLTEDDGVAMLLAMDMLRNRYFVELRTKRSLSYAPSAFYAQGILNNPYAAVYISTNDPKQAMEVMVAEIQKIKKEGFDPQELINKKAGYLTNYYMGKETLSSQAASLGMAELRGDWRMADQFTDMVNEVSLEDINEAFDKYTNNISWTYLGDLELVTEEDFGQPVKP
ncbi:MAG: insulinase family protein, partial [Bacteroidota bacterium]